MTTAVNRLVTPRTFPLFGRLFAASLFVFFGAAFVISAANLDLGEPLMGLIRWGHHDARHYELMVEVIYLAWAAFLWIASGNPRQHWLFLDFTVVGNLGHFSLMAALGMTMHGEMEHLYGDVLLGFVGLAGFAVPWLMVRGQIRAAA